MKLAPLKIGVGIQENSLLPSHKQQILQKFKFLCLLKK
jgi:hypothetical protein